MAYVSIVSMCLGFFAWYQGLARGGVARVGRLQLAQPALTLGWSALLLGEHVSALSAVAAAAVIAVTAIGRNARVDGSGTAAEEPSKAAFTQHAAYSLIPGQPPLTAASATPPGCDDPG
jgi:hypothetical protein